jgi:hypothetical protein
MFSNQRIIALTILLLLIVGCKKPTQAVTEPEGYRVVSYDSNTREWTIIRTGTFDGKFLRKRIVLICQSYTLGAHPTVSGEDACHLVVGRLIVSNLMPQDRKDFIDVFEMSNGVISITEGDWDDRVTQQFKILKYEVLADER